MTSIRCGWKSYSPCNRMHFFKAIFLVALMNPYEMEVVLVIKKGSQIRGVEELLVYWGQ